MTHTATYSPEDNKLRLYPACRLERADYERVKEAGFFWAPRQQLFYATWRPDAEDLLIEMCGDIADEDTTLVERAEQRAERFAGYQENRTADAQRANAAVSAIADNIPLGQPILVGHHSEKHARKDAERIENGMRKAIRMWDGAEYWGQRAAGAVRAAKYHERPDVRARRIRKIEAELRKAERAAHEARTIRKLWSLENITLEQARAIAERVPTHVVSHDGTPWSAYDILRPEDERYRRCPMMTLPEVIERVTRNYLNQTARQERWIAHYSNRLTYERALLAAAGGTETDKTKPEKGGAAQCWASPYGGWSYITKVNKVSVTVLRNWGNGGQNFTQTVPFDGLRRLMTATEVRDARAQGLLIETSDKTGFMLVETAPAGSKPAPAKTPPEPTPAQSLRNALADIAVNGRIKVRAVDQLFPTPRDLAARMADAAEIQPGHRVLEPSAGTGRLLGAMGDRMIERHGERRAGDAVAVEIDYDLAEQLSRDFPLTRVHCGDFLTLADKLGTFDRIVMNPPFARGADIRHIKQAMQMLRPGGRLVAICANGPRQQDELRPYASEWIELPDGTFAETGTKVRTAMMLVQAGAA